ncbi:MAG TPA: hypothetical protein VMV69_01450 [Pirellulales bacterium]|nr:hypothetical protein [Pirellulales bacterium]
MNGRVTEGHWRKDLSQLRDSIFYCSCGIENFYDTDAVKASGGTLASCWSCKKELRLPFRIRVGTAIVMLSHEGRLFAHHLDPSKDFDFTKPCAEVTRHPSDPSIWGLKNCTAGKWVATMWRSWTLPAAWPISALRVCSWSSHPNSQGASG